MTQYNVSVYSPTCRDLTVSNDNIFIFHPMVIFFFNLVMFVPLVSLMKFLVHVSRSVALTIKHFIWLYKIYVIACPWTDIIINDPSFLVFFVYIHWRGIYVLWGLLEHLLPPYMYESLELSNLRFFLTRLARKQSFYPCHC